MSELSDISAKNACFRWQVLVKMYYFALALADEMDYSLAALRGGTEWIFEN
jgi:hypothetical protein